MVLVQPSDPNGRNEADIVSSLPPISEVDKLRLIGESKTAFYDRRRVQIPALPPGITRDVSYPIPRPSLFNIPQAKSGAKILNSSSTRLRISKKIEEIEADWLIHFRGSIREQGLLRSLSIPTSISSIFIDPNLDLFDLYRFLPFSF